MTISATATAAPPRRLGRSVAALAFGFVAVVVLSLGTDELLHLLKVYPPWSQPMYDTGLCLLALSYRIVYTVLGRRGIRSRLRLLPCRVPGWAGFCTREGTADAQGLSMCEGWVVLGGANDNSAVPPGLESFLPLSQR